MCISVQMCTRYTFYMLAIIWIKTNLRYFCLKLIMLIDEISNTLKVKLPKFPPQKNKWSYKMLSNGALFNVFGCGLLYASWFVKTEY